ncbi:SRPBCC family protein [Denitrobaculum tricleocarpae]|uniref:SRPBCC domain-containing protein n=1 Tax=Denitrobaculum tricleocarpae TaxID=2591009 RepID=A0A545U301_9PROT|nr:SRPBCC domain-containing protein [Denitrobaculum tricleocarpae]TQV83793.1 SRPBCC domain-containing protein [Denitrobaculum tricleocarpae]
MSELTHSVTVRRLLPAQPARVFEAFSSAEALGRWFTPRPDISLEILAFEFVPEGAFRFCFIMPGDERKAVAGRYERIMLNDEIVFSWTWETPDPHADIPTRVRVRFRAQDGGTEIVLTHSQLPSEESSKRHGEGWTGMFEQLEAGFADPQFLRQAEARPETRPETRDAAHA